MWKIPLLLFTGEGVTGVADPESAEIVGFVVTDVVVGAQVHPVGHVYVVVTCDGAVHVQPEGHWKFVPEEVVPDEDVEQP